MPYECLVLRAASLNWTGISSDNSVIIVMQGIIVKV